MRTAPLLRLSTDDTLARRAAHGDDDAFALLYDRYRVRLEAYCRGIVRHDEDAGDAAQNALAAAYQALRRGTQPQSVRPWLFRIAHNEAISVLRRRRVADELPDSLPARVAAPDDALALREELAAVLDAVRDLAPGARSALLLRELGGLAYPQVAEVLGTTPASARQAVFEARTALQADRAGRGTDCEAIRRELSTHDGRRRQARHIRGHLRGCGSCRDWSRAQRQRRQRLALGGIPLPLTGWLAALFGGAASAGGGATVSSGLALQAQVATAMTAVLAAGAAPIVADRAMPDAPAPAPAAATASGAAALPTSAGAARLLTTTAAPARDLVAIPVRAAATRSAAAGDGGGAERRGSGLVDRGDTAAQDEPPARRFAADRPRRGDRDRERADWRPAAEDGWGEGDGRRGGREGGPRRDRAPWRPARERPAAVEADVPDRPPAPAPATEPEPAPADAPEADPPAAPEAGSEGAPAAPAPEPTPVAEEQAPAPEAG